jgi:transposase
MQTTSFIGMDVHKATISISIAEDGRNGPVRFLGVIPNAPEDIAKMAKRLSRHGELDFCYEAGGCGYGIYRQLTTLGHRCMVVATSMIPRKPGERIKTDRRDSQKLAILHRSGDLTPVWVPDATHEALRDLVRARVDATMHLMRARQQLLAFLLRHGRSYTTGKNWTQRHRSWLAGQTFELPVHRIVFQDYVEAVWAAQERRDTLIDRIEEMVASWSLGPLVEALRGLRGIDMISAATFIATTGDLSRFDSPRLLMGYLGLVPSEHSSGGNIRRGGITKTGNREARRMLIEAAWSYRYPARVAKEKAEILVRLPKIIRDIAWKAQTRLCARYRSLIAKGKKPTVVVAALARELAGFVWAIGQEMRDNMQSSGGEKMLRA